MERKPKRRLNQVCHRHLQVCITPRYFSLTWQPTSADVVVGHSGWHQLMCQFSHFPLDIQVTYHTIKNLHVSLLLVMCGKNSCSYQYAYSDCKCMAIILKGVPTYWPCKKYVDSEVTVVGLLACLRSKICKMYPNFDLSSRQNMAEKLRKKHRNTYNSRLRTYLLEDS